MDRDDLLDAAWTAAFDLVAALDALFWHRFWWRLFGPCVSRVVLEGYLAWSVPRRPPWEDPVDDPEHKHPPAGRCKGA